LVKLALAGEIISSHFIPILIYMTNTYSCGSMLTHCLRRLMLAVLLASGVAVTAQAQLLNYSTAAATNVAGTYTDLASTGTVIATATTDDANSAAQPIGFTFNYNGTDFTQFVLNTNGFIKLGSAAPSAAALFLDETANSTLDDPFQNEDANIIAPFNIDLTAGSAGTEYRVATTGSAGSRICTIQWKNVRDKANVSPTQYANMSFQVRLYEGTNVVELVYGPTTAGTSPAGRIAQIGLKGSSFDSGQIVQVTKPQPGAAWSTATFADFSDVISSGFLNIVAIASVALPDVGRTFRFTPVPPLANDVAVRTVYTLGKVATVGGQGQAVSVYILNLSTVARTNVPVTLTISGANTFTRTATIATLGVGAQGFLSLGNLPATLNPGTNTVTVSVPADDNNANNTVSVAQLVTADRLSYIEPSKATDGALSGSSSSAGSVLAVKYTVPSTTVLSNAVVSFANVGSSLTTEFAIVVYDATGTNGAPGTLLYTSPSQNRPATSGDVTVTLPALQVNGSFYVGVKEVGSTGVALATQKETPLRSTTFFYSASGSTPWSDIANSTFQSRLAIEVGLAPVPCAAPTGLTITGVTPTNAVLTFTDAANVGSYQVVYGPAGFQPATGGTTVTATASPLTLTGLQPGTNYEVYVRTNCTGGGNSLYAGPVAFSAGCNASTAITTFPYTEGFESIVAGQPLPCGFNVLDANNDGATWAITKSTPYAGVNALRYTSALSNSVAANDWFFTPALTLAANTRYQLAFRYRGEGIAPATSNYTEKLEVKAGAAPTPAGQTTTLYTNAAITNTSYALANATSTPAVAVLQPGASTQYVGFHVYSDASQGNLYIDDISITSAVGLATSTAMMRAVTVFPNPSATGVFDLEVHGANAQKGLDVEVVNNLGQRVYVGTARDNFTNRLDLSTLATGLYHLKVRAGNDYMLRQISIVK
jgi:hypothetical protein